VVRRAASPRERQSSASGTERAVFWLGVALLLVLPVVWDSDCMEAFRGPKRDVAMVLWATLAATFVAGNLRGTAWRDPWWLPWAGVLAGGVASAAASGHPGIVLVRCVPLALAALGWGALRQLPEAARRRLAVVVVVAGVLQAALTAALLLPSFQPEAFGMISSFSGRYKWIGLMGNPADVGVFLVPPIVLATAFALRQRRHRWTYAIAAAAMAATALGTRTLTAAIALACGLALLLWRYLPRRARVPALAGVAVLALTLAVVGPMAGRVRGAIGEFRHGGWMSIGSGRGAGFASALGMIAARPVTGVGFGLFENNSFRFQSEDVLARRARLLRLETAFGEAHNDLLQYAAETGLLGVLLAAAGLALAWRKAGRVEGVLPTRLALAAAMAPLALAQFPTHLAAIAAQWAVLAALALPQLPAPPEPADRWRRLARWAAVAVVAGAASYVAWQRYVGSIAWQQASTLARAILAGQVKQGRIEAARAALGRLEPRLIWFPGAWEAQVVTGNVAMQAGRPDVALSHFHAALELAERPEIRFDVGMALLAVGDTETGYAHLIRAVKLNPWIYGQIGNPEVADSLRRRLDADGYGKRYPWIYDLRPEDGS
jgi:O-antigen ligase